MNIKRIPITVISLLIFVSLFLGVFIAQHLSSKKKIDLSHFNGTYIEHPSSIRPFNLTGIDNRSFDNNSMQGHWTLIFFGFTQCGTLCPTTMAELGKMYGILKDKGIQNLPQVVMITLDPKRDDLNQLKHYVKTFNPNFYGARGEEGLIQLITKELGIAYEKITQDSRVEHYDIQHSGALLLFNPQGELNVIFTTPHKASSLAQDYMSLVS